MFKYNGKIWNPKNPEKKLKQLGITWDDVEIIDTPAKADEKPIEYVNTKFYYFINKDKQLYMKSIYPVSDTEGFIPCTREELLKEFPNCNE